MVMRRRTQCPHHHHHCKVRIWTKGRPARMADGGRTAAPAIPGHWISKGMYMYLMRNVRRCYCSLFFDSMYFQADLLISSKNTSSQKKSQQINTTSNNILCIIVSFFCKKLLAN